jgi:hypothetical protein
LFRLASSKIAQNETGDSRKMRLQARLVGFTLLILPSIGFSAAFVVLWPKPVSPILAGMAMLAMFGAMLFLCTGARPEIALQMQKAIFLGAGIFGAAYVALALKYRNSASAFSLASAITAAMLGVGALGSLIIIRSSQRRKTNTKG